MYMEIIKCTYCSNIFKRESPKASKRCPKCESRRKSTEHIERMTDPIYAQEYNKKRALQAKKQRQLLRETVIKGYGGKCACCGETAMEFLGIDHINNDGAKHRKLLGYGTYAVYREIIRNRFPKGRFQVLCWNCNLAKAFYGLCPHLKQGGGKEL